MSKTPSIDYFNRHHGKGQSKFKRSSSYWIAGIALTIVLEGLLRLGTYAWTESMSPYERQQMKSSVMYKMQEKHTFITFGLIQTGYEMVFKPKKEPNATPYQNK